MLIGIIVGVLFGLGTTFAIGPIKDFTKSRFELSEQEGGILAFGVMMLIGSVVVSLLSGGLSAFWLVFGGLLGAFGKRLVALGKTFVAERSAAAKSSAEEVAETVSDAADDGLETVKDVADDAVEGVSDAAEEVAKKVT